MSQKGNSKLLVIVILLIVVLAVSVFAALNATNIMPHATDVSTTTQTAMQQPDLTNYQAGPVVLDSLRVGRLTTLAATSLTLTLSDGSSKVFPLDKSTIYVNSSTANINSLPASNTDSGFKTLVEKPISKNDLTIGSYLEIATLGSANKISRTVLVKVL